jgi:hypothetical protein
MFWKKKEPVDLSINAARERLRVRMPWMHWKEEDRRDFLILQCSERQLAERVHELNLKNLLLLQSVMLLIQVNSDSAKPKAKPKVYREPKATPKVKAKPA